MRKIFAVILAGCLLLGSLPAAASSGEESESSQKSGVAERWEQMPMRTRMWLILGGTVVGVAGMWLNLYRRGK